jgi:ABC-type Fe3+ transport system permease subunit
MSNNRQQTLWELHKENSFFLNKLLVGIPATSIPLLFTAINDAKDRLSHWILLVTLIIVGFTLFLLIHSFFVSEKAIEAVDQNKYKKANILNKRTKRYNFVSMIMLCVSFCLIVILFVMQGYRKEIDNMTAKDGKRTFNTDGLSLPPSFVIPTIL